MTPMHRIWSLLAVACALNFAGMAFGQSKEETKEFIVKKVTEARNSMGSDSYSYTKYRFDGDIFVEEAINKSRKDGKSYGWINTTPLKDANPNRVEVVVVPTLERTISHVSVRIWPTDSKKNQFRVKYDSEGTTKESGSHSLMVPDQRTANQLAKAFRHLITLCGGKGELFEE